MGVLVDDISLAGVAGIDIGFVDAIGLVSFTIGVDHGSIVSLTRDGMVLVIDAPQSGLKGFSQTLNKLLRCATTPRCATAPSWQRPLASLQSRSEDQRGLSNALTRMKPDLCDKTSPLSN